MDSSMLPTRYTTLSIRRSSFLGHFLSILVRGEVFCRGDAIFGLYVIPSGDPYMCGDRGDGGKILSKSSFGGILVIVESYSAISQHTKTKIFELLVKQL
jgi:hypothetical protein